MSRLEIRRITSTVELRDVAPQWDELRARCAPKRPTAQADLIADWLEQFAPDQPLEAIAVADKGRLVGVLPLVSQRVAKVIDAGGLPGDEWSTAGDLMIDPQAGRERIAGLIARELGRLSWPMLWLEAVEVQRPDWTALLTAIREAGRAAEITPGWEVGWLDIGDDWQAIHGRLSKNMRRSLARGKKRLMDRGEVKFSLLTDVSAEQIELLLRRAFAAEQRSWKGRAGTAILDNPAQFQFYLQQARRFAKRGQFALALLEVDQAVAAYEYAWISDNIYYSFKVGYDAEFAASSPGQLLMGWLLQRFHETGECRAVDCMGPVSDAILRWKPTLYPVSRVVIGAPSVVGRALLAGYQLFRTARDSWANRQSISCW